MLFTGLCKTNYLIIIGSLNFFPIYSESTIGYIRGIEQLRHSQRICLKLHAVCGLYYTRRYNSAHLIGVASQRSQFGKTIVLYEPDWLIGLYIFPFVVKLHTKKPYPRKIIFRRRYPLFPIISRCRVCYLGSAIQRFILPPISYFPGNTHHINYYTIATKRNSIIPIEIERRSFSPGNNLRSLSD